MTPRLTRSLLGLAVFILLQPAAFADSMADGVKAYSQRNYRLAVQKFEQIVRTQPQNSTAYYYLGVSNQALGNVAKAQQYYQLVSQRFAGTPAAALASQALGVAPQESHSSSSSNSHVRTYSGGSDTAGDDSSQPQQTRVYFTREGNSLIVDAQINHRPVKMVFDTGASGCVVGVNQLEELGIPRPSGPPTGATVGVGSNEPIKVWSMNADIKVGGVEKHNVPLMVQENLAVHPLLGETFFGGLHYTIDNGANAIIFQNKAATTSAGGSGYSVPFKREGNELIVDVEVNGRTCKMFFDTGADGITFTKDHLQKLGIVIPEDADSVRSTGVGGETTGKSFTIKRMRMGPVDKSDITVGTVDNAGMQYPLLGQTFYKDWQYTIDNENNVIHFVRR